MKKSSVITFLIFVAVIISVFVFIFNKKLLVENVPTIILNKEEFQRGDNVIAKILIPSNNNYYISSCTSIYYLYSLYYLNENKEWVLRTINPENGECSPYCKDDVSSPDGGCEQKWSMGICNSFCQKLEQDDKYHIKFNWDMNFYEYENKGCGNKRGVFKFAKPAPSGQYKFQYTYFDDEECKFKNSAEKIFVIK